MHDNALQNYFIKGVFSISFIRKMGSGKNRFVCLFYVTQTCLDAMSYKEAFVSLKSEHKHIEAQRKCKRVHDAEWALLVIFFFFFSTEN